MRLWEAALTILHLPAWCWFMSKLLFHRKLRLPVMLKYSWVALILAALVAHLWLEGGRWQMGPAYILTAAGGLSSLLNRKATRVKPLRLRYIRIILGCLAGLTGLVLLQLPWLVPVPRLPAPEGPYVVGTRSYHWVDASRPETEAGLAQGPRELMVQLWYPADQGAAASPSPSAPYVPGLPQLAGELEKQTGVPAQLLSYLNLADTHAKLDVPISTNQPSYPVILFSHGWPGFRFTYHYLLAGLASQGYIVAAIDHTGGASAVVFPEGRVVTAAEGPDELDLPAWDKLIDEIWAKDDGFVLDKLAQLNAADPDGLLNGHIDLQRIGVMGHSFGGDNALAVLGQDRRFKAGISLDGAFYGASGSNKLKEQAFLWICTEQSTQYLGLPRPSEEGLRRAGLTRQQYEKYLSAFRLRHDTVKQEGSELMLKGITHSSLSDLYLFSPVLRFRDRGPDPIQAHKKVLGYVTGFFNQQLTASPSSGAH